MRLRPALFCSLLALPMAPAAARPDGWLVETVDAPTYQVFDASIAVDPSGIPHIVYWTPGVGLRYASRDGSPWSLTSVVAHAEPLADVSPASPQLINVWSASLAIDAQGTPHVATANSNFDSYQILYWTRDALGWVSSYPGTVYGAEPTIALDSEGQPRIVALQRFSSDLEYLEQNGGAWSAPYGFPGDVAYNHMPIAVDASGNPHIGYSASGVIQHLWRDGAGWHSEVVDSGGAAVGALAIGSDGAVRIAYRGVTHALTYAIRGPSGWSRAVVDPSGDAATGIALALDRHDEPRIAFYDATTMQVRYAWSGVGVWTLATVDPDSGANYISLALAGDGTPHIAFVDAGLTRLLYARGASTTGVPGRPFPARPWLQAAPNPMRVGGAVTLSMTLPAADRVGFEVFDLAGRLVAARSPEAFAAGSAARAWSPALSRPGVYLLRWRGESGIGGSRRLVALP